MIKTRVNNGHLRRVHTTHTIRSTIISKGRQTINNIHTLCTYIFRLPAQADKFVFTTF